MGFRLNAIWMALACTALAASPGRAGPVPPCEAAPIPEFGAVDSPPRAQVWKGEELAGWQPPPCLQWRPGGRLVAALASRFRSSRNVFESMADVAAWPQLRYWSISHQAWRPLALAASFPDLQPIATWSAGKTSLFTERDENTGEATYRLTVLERRPGRLVVATENVTAIKLALFTAFEPGALQTVTFLQNDGPDVWTSYQITRVGMASSAMALSHSGSFLNRLEALRRHLAGLPSDQTPPVAPR